MKRTLTALLLAATLLTAATAAWAGATWERPARTALGATWE